MNSSAKRPNWAMRLTVFRLAVCPVFAWLFFLEAPWARISILVLALLAEISDLLDGYLARKMNQVSDLGKLLDPLADRMTHLTFFLCFTWAHLAPLAFILVILYREALIETLRALAVRQGIVIAARWSGKLKTASMAFGILLILAIRIAEPDYPEVSFSTVYFIILLVITLLTLWSLVDYLMGNRDVLKKMVG